LLILSDKKKFFPTTQKSVFTINSINSAQATDFSTHLFRSEELFKLIIHELIHYFKIDQGFKNGSVIQSNFAINPININIRWSEVIAECFAEFINLIVTTELIYPDNFEKFDKLYEKEV